MKTNIAVLGAQWGDEGKGKIVDMLTPHFSAVARYQGGHNAGHTVYVNGKKAGSGGDIATKTTAFDETKSHKITTLVKPGEEMTIAVHVYDWYGAGGIFRPVTLTTSPEGMGSLFVR